jgi:hypothetical protein
VLVLSWAGGFLWNIQERVSLYSVQGIKIGQREERTQTPKKDSKPSLHLHRLVLSHHSELSPHLGIHLSPEDLKPS